MKVSFSTLVRGIADSQAMSLSFRLLFDEITNPNLKD